MHDFTTAIALALGLVTSADADLLEIIALSLRVSLSAVLLSCAIGLPLGATLAVMRFRGRGVLLILINALHSDTA